MSRQFESQKISIAFASSGATAVDTTLGTSYLGRLLGVKVKGHTWTTAGHSASGASAANVQILDPDGDSLWLSSEVLTGATSFFFLEGSTTSAGIIIEPNCTLRYKFLDGNIDARCVSGRAYADVLADLPTATVKLYLQE